MVPGRLTRKGEPITTCRRLGRLTPALLVALALAAAPAIAQEQGGAVEGTVRDQSGATVPGATVEAREASGLVQATVSDALGAYRFPSLPPGTWEMLVRLEGFAPVRQPDVRLALGQPRLDRGLPVRRLPRRRPGFTLGGPIIRERLWFFGSYIPSFQTTDRTGTYLSNGETGTVRRTDRSQFATATLSAQLGPRWYARAGVKWAP